MRDPGLAAVLSAIIPGVRQFYNGRVLAGILWLIITPRLLSARAACSVGYATSLRPTPLTRMPAIPGAYLRPDICWTSAKEVFSEVQLQHPA